MSVFVQDSFTDTDGTQLTGHTGEAGASWTSHGSYTSGAAVITGNRARISSIPGLYYASGTPASAEYDVQSGIVQISAVAFVGGVAGRINTAADTFYSLRWHHLNGRWELDKMVTGTSTSLGTFSDTYSAGGTKTAKLEMRDAAKKAFIDGTERISNSDNAITAAGRAGLTQPASGSGATTRYHFDNFLATNAVATQSNAPRAMHYARMMRAA